jgi:hypothetical protein
MAKKLMSAVMALLMCLSCASATAQSTVTEVNPSVARLGVAALDSKKATSSVAYLPMARKGEIASPKELAERIRESLRKDATGNGRVLGANITPVGFLTAVKKAGATVDGVGALPAYLDSLIERDMPSGMITMSRVILMRDKKGRETPLLDVEKGFAREAHKGERGHYDANTGYLIMAGDCSNSPLVVTMGPVEPPKPAPLLAVSPAPAPVPTFQGCVEGKFLVVNLWDNAAVKVVSADGKQSVAAMIADASNDEPGVLKPNRVSRAFWKTFLDMEAKGTLARARGDHAVEVFVVTKDGVRIDVARDVVKQGRFRVAMPSEFLPGGVLRIVFPGQRNLISPVQNGNGIHVAYPEYTGVGCGFNFHVAGIEGVSFGH